MDIYFYLILGIAAVLGIAFAVSIKGILYHTPDTDNELMAYAAAQSHKWRWPSDVHKYGLGKTAMKDLSIFLIAIFQKIFRDNTSDYPYTVMSGLFVSVSGVLIYLITANYFNPLIGLAAGLLYLCSFWSWQVSLYGGHANVANLFFLLSIFALQWPMIGLLSSLWSFALAGAFFCFALFSSPSAYKYSASFLVAASYTRFILLSQTNAPASSYSIYSMAPTPLINIIAFFLPLIAALSWILLWHNQKRLVTALYYKKAPKPWNRLITGQDIFPLEHYLSVARRKLKAAGRTLAAATVLILIALYFIGLEFFSAILAGFVLTFLFLTFPHIQKNTKIYMEYLLVSPRKTHFRAYIDYYAKRGVTLAQNMRGVGWPWVPKMLWKFMPFHLVIFIASGISLAGYALRHNQIDNLIKTVLLILVSLLPIIWAEITRAPQASRLYSPALITMTILTAYALSQIQPFLHEYWYLFVLALTVVAAWNLFIFVIDIYPPRMAARNLLAEIRRRKIQDIYTYKTQYNDEFVMNIPGFSRSKYLPPKNIEPPFKVHFIQSLTEVNDGWIVIPPTSSKSLTMSCQSEAMIDDYTKDPVLNNLLENRSLDQAAARRFPAYGASQIWVNEDDITSWRSLIRHEIGPDDLYRGYGWLIHSGKLKPLIQFAK